MQTICVNPQIKGAFQGEFNLHQTLASLTLWTGPPYMYKSFLYNYAVIFQQKATTERAITHRQTV